MKLALQSVRRNLGAKPALPNVSTCAQCASSDSAIGTFRTLFRNRRAVSVSLSEFFRYRSRDVKRHASKPSTLMKNPGGGGVNWNRPAPSRPLRSSLSPSYAPRGDSIPSTINQLRILPVATGLYHFFFAPFPIFNSVSLCLCGKSIAFILLQALCRRQKSQPLCNQGNPASFLQNTRGGGCPRCGRTDAPLAPSRTNSYRRLANRLTYDSRLETYNSAKTRGGRCNRSWS